jgi:hypothetical protein
MGTMCRRLTAAFEDMSSVHHGRSAAVHATWRSSRSSDVGWKGAAWLHWGHELARWPRAQGRSS